jgi:hypothetical protein
MDPESERLLKETFELEKDNNLMLRKLRNGQRWASIMRGIYWLIIIGISIGAFYFLQPYVEQMESFIKSTGITIGQVQNVFQKNTNTSLPR